MDLSFESKTVVITGGSQGIGAAISRQFVRSGANVMVDYLPVERDIVGLENLVAEFRQDKGKIESYAGDVTDPTAMEKLVQRTVECFGGIDILVNSAGYTRPSTLSELDVDLWKRGIEVNLSGAYYITRAVANHMLDRKAGRIIYIGSASSITGGGGSAAYSAAKAGIIGLVRAMNKELAPHGITVNAVLPALIDTDLLKTREPDADKRGAYVSRIPIGRLGTAEDVAYVTLFLASEYSAFITGQNIIVDGGSTFA